MLFRSVDEEAREPVGGDEPQQPGDGGVGDQARDHGRDERGPPADRCRDVVRLDHRLQQARGHERRDPHEERQPRGRHPVEAQEQTGREFEF